MNGTGSGAAVLSPRSQGDLKMRQLLPLTFLAGLLALGVAGASAGWASAGGASRAASSASHSDSRWTLTLSPQPDDLALAEVRFHPRSKPSSVSLLRVVASGPFGDDYLTVAAPRGHSSRDAWALILLVNRPSPLLDPTAVKLTVSAPDSLGAHIVRRVEDPFARAVAAKRPSLCDLTSHGSPLGAGALRRIRSAGTALAGFNSVAAVAQAYDAACGLSYAQAFRQAVTGASSSPAPSPPTPTPSPPAPTPVPGPPHCVPCDPDPGIACPDRTPPDICVDQALASSPRSISAGH
jgi:hypothetical protein